jgi:hypothetical protein
VEVMTCHRLDERLKTFVAYGMAGVSRLTGTSASDGIFVDCSVLAINWSLQR